MIGKMARARDSVAIDLNWKVVPVWGEAVGHAFTREVEARFEEDGVIASLPYDDDDFTDPLEIAVRLPLGSTGDDYPEWRIALETLVRDVIGGYTTARSPTITDIPGRVLVRGFAAEFRRLADICDEALKREEAQAAEQHGPRPGGSRVPPKRALSSSEAIAGDCSSGQA